MYMFRVLIGQHTGLLAVPIQLTTRDPEGLRMGVIEMNM